MKNQTAPKARATTSRFEPRLIGPERHIERLRHLQEAIACRAYELFESRGCEHGQDHADWLQAESEILRPIPVKVSESEERLTVQAELPGFNAEEIQVSAEPRRLIISGSASQTNEEEKENVFYREILAKDVFRSLDLPVEVDAVNAEASLRDGILSITLPKLTAGKPSQAQASAV
jgi:HSP20 family molecular chaperone IbpA